MTRPPDEEAEAVVRRARAKRQIITLLVIFAITCATAWIWSWPAKAAPPAEDSSVIVLAQGPRNCEQWVAGWVSVPVECDREPLPPIVRKCAGAAAVGALLAYISGGTSLLFGAGSGLAGCIPWAGADD